MSGFNKTYYITLHCIEARILIPATMTIHFLPVRFAPAAVPYGICPDIACRPRPGRGCAYTLFSSSRGFFFCSSSHNCRGIYPPYSFPNQYVLPHDRHPSTASYKLARSSSKVSPWVAQPGIAGTSAQKPPSSAS